MIQLLALLLIASQPQPVSLNDLQFMPSHDLSMNYYAAAEAERLATETPETWKHPLQSHYDRYLWVEFKFKAWNLLSDAHMTHYSNRFREECLMKLRTLLGAEAYYNGRLP